MQEFVFLFKYSTLSGKGNNQGIPSGAGGYPGAHHPQSAPSGGEPADADYPGLSQAHIRPRAGKITLWDGGSFLKVQKAVKNQAVGGGKRGKITGFSRASRRRMLYMLAKTLIKSVPYMITLTYPSEFVSPRASKRHLKLFIQRLERKFRASGGVWKLEPQKRGAPHYHVLLWTTASYLELRGWCATTWYYIVGTNDEKHLRAGTRVEKIRSPRGVMAYAGKYVAKTSENLDLDPEIIAMWDDAGRWWGVFGRDNIPWAPEIVENLDYKQVVGLMRLVRRYARIRARQYQSLSIFCLAEFWKRRLAQILECVT